MSVENSKVIDFITNHNSKVVLTISDHLEWIDSNEHVFLLQEKINAYLKAVESGQISKYVDSPNSKIVISIAVKYAPSEMGIRFFAKVKETLLEAGYQFDYYVL